jgi:Tfp pilus assembly protein PilO
MIRGFTPKAVATRQMHAEWPIGLQLEGTYHDIGALLDRISKFPRIINVSSIRIRGQATPDDSNTVTADATATTFVLTETKAAAPAAQPATN